MKWLAADREEELLHGDVALLGRVDGHRRGEGREPVRVAREEGRAPEGRAVRHHGQPALDTFASNPLESKYY